MILARADAYPDALGAAPLAKLLKAPVILTQPGSLPASVKAKLSAKQTKKVIILGGTGAVSSAVETEITGLGITTERIAGVNRYQTSLKIAQQTIALSGGKALPLLVATGRNFPDALAAGAAAAHTGAGFLLADTPLSPETLTLIQAAPSVTAIGGPAERTLSQAGVQHASIAGKDRFDTAAQIAAKFFPAPKGAYIATGVDFPDALAASAAAGLNGTPILLTQPQALPSTTKAWLDANKSLTATTIIGGTGAVSPEAVKQISGETTPTPDKNKDKKDKDKPSTSSSGSSGGYSGFSGGSSSSGSGDSSGGGSTPAPKPTETTTPTPTPSTSPTPSPSSSPAPGNTEEPVTVPTNSGLRKCLYSEKKTEAGEWWLSFDDLNNKFDTVEAISCRGIIENIDGVKVFVNAHDLSFLDASIKSLPKEIGQLQNLHTLNLGGNQLTSIPTEILQLQNLQALNLGENQLTSFPKEILQLQNLQHLYLGGNQLTSIPKEISQLQNLQHLYLGGNQLTSFPKEISQLQNLTSLDLGENQLTSFPKEIGQLQNLQTLNLWRNQLTSFPTEILQLQNLQHLVLRDNKLTSIPTEISQLKNLQYLYLEDNKLTSIPKEISQLQNLQYLNLRDNPGFDGNTELWNLPPQTQVEPGINCNADGAQCKSPKPSN